MGLTIDHDLGREALDVSVAAFVDVASSVSEHELLGASRCHGWSRLDVVVHVLTGWQELLGGLACTTDAPADVDAASYWTGFAESVMGVDPVLALMAQRRRSAVYSRPSAALDQLHDVAAQVYAGAARSSKERHGFQGRVLTSGDLLATWAVEVTVHHLDLDVPGTPHPAGLRLAQRTVETLAGEPFPEHWDDARVVRLGTGREPVADDLGAPGARLPVLG